MRSAAKVLLTLGALFGGVVLFTVVAPDEAHAVVSAVQTKSHVAFLKMRAAGHEHSHEEWKNVNWEVVKAAKTGFFERAKRLQMAKHRPEGVMEKMSAGLRAKLVEAGVPADHVDSMVNKWVKAAEACDGKEGDELAECYKTATECHHGFTGKDNA